jgi:hypothetical protein
MSGDRLQPLEDREPWTWRREVLGSIDPEDPVFQRALASLFDHMDRHHLGQRREDAQALAALDAAALNLAERAEAAEPSDVFREVAGRVALARGQLLSSAGHAGKAAAALEAALIDVAPGTPPRGELLIALAAARAQVAAASSQPTVEAATERSAGLAALVEAVEAEHYSDWARIRWYDDLQPLQADPAYSALLARHGRTAVPTVAGGPPDER